MKLNENFITHNNGDVKMLISMDHKVFPGMIKLNDTAFFIVQCLKEETSIEEIADKLTEKYEVDCAQARNDAEMIIAQLRTVGAISET